MFDEELSTIDTKEEPTINQQQKYNEVKELLDTESNIRFRDLMPRNLKKAKIAVIGCGAIGSWTVQQLVKIGCSNISIFDDDTVDIQNIGPQGYGWVHLGKPKVEALKEMAFEDKGIHLTAFNERITNYMHMITLLNEVPDIIISAVDNMEFRNEFIGKNLLANFINENSNVTNPVLELYNGRDNYNKYMLDPCEISHTEDMVNFLKMFPKLVFDARMTLGTWNLFILPIKHILSVPTYSINIRLVEALEKTVVNYLNDNFFKTEDALQEPCTARAINFTGAALASKILSAIFYFYTNNELFTSDLLYQKNTTGNSSSQPLGNVHLNKKMYDKYIGFYENDRNIIPHTFTHVFNTLEFNDLNLRATVFNKVHKLVEDKECILHNFKQLLAFLLLNPTLLSSYSKKYYQGDAQLKMLAHIILNTTEFDELILAKDYLKFHGTISDSNFMNALNILDGLLTENTFMNKSLMMGTSGYLDKRLHTMRKLNDLNRSLFNNHRSILQATYINTNYETYEDMAPRVYTVENATPLAPAEMFKHEWYSTKNMSSTYIIQLLRSMIEPLDSTKIHKVFTPLTDYAMLAPKYVITCINNEFINNNSTYRMDCELMGAAFNKLMNIMLAPYSEEIREFIYDRNEVDFYSEDYQTLTKYIDNYEDAILNIKQHVVPKIPVFMEQDHMYSSIGYVMGIYFSSYMYKGADEINYIVHEASVSVVPESYILRAGVLDQTKEDGWLTSEGYWGKINDSTRSYQLFNVLNVNLPYFEEWMQQ